MTLLVRLTDKQVSGFGLVLRTKPTLSCIVLFCLRVRSLFAHGLSRTEAIGLQMGLTQLETIGLQMGLTQLETDGFIIGLQSMVTPPYLVNRSRQPSFSPCRPFARWPFERQNRASS